jgi:hypothetical protein
MTSGLDAFSAGRWQIERAGIALDESLRRRVEAAAYAAFLVS